jgi:ubiquitin thioesterase OTU1
MQRRVIDADNSCLFNAVGYLVLNDKAHPDRLRNIIRDKILSNQTIYDEAFLGKKTLGNGISKRFHVK